MKIILGTGGSGGHVVPALELAKHLRTLKHDVLAVGAARTELGLFDKNGFRFIPVCGEGWLNRGIFQRLKASGLLFKGFWQAMGIMRRERPQVVVGFGGYGSLPAVLAGIVLRIPSIIHEQNVMPGKANRLLSRFVRKTTISFPQTKSYLAWPQAVLTGCPCNVVPAETDPAAIKMIYDYFHFSPARKTLLVFGGSQGSSFINNSILKVLILLKDEIDIQVIHLTGQAPYEEVKNAYNEIGIPVALFPFFDKMNYAYSIADVVLSRAGAVTVSEILLAQKSAILIPYPYAAEGHQKLNAVVLEQAHLGKIIEEEDLTVEVLRNAILERLNNAPRKDRRRGEVPLGFPRPLLI